MAELGMVVAPVITNNVTGETTTLDVIEHETRPLYDLRNLETGAIATQYATDVSARASGTYSDNISDSTLSVTAYATLFYITETVSGEIFAGLDKVSWRYEISDNAVALKNLTHKYQQSGAGQGTSTAIDQRNTLYPTALSGTDLVRNWGWTKVSILGTFYKYGVEMTSTLYRTNNPTYTWTMNLQVYQVGIL
ncbi:hypothetical protein [Cohnella cholangitidis]|uniref:Uncharacterized protein n=1 Tax=Cohnella cholangitidis TaxID=2598458 RepID=A0A7G5C329_9BACL|nr:hypothetical protein [Cohnella cholangitidis]QMV43613.1 hypothetical protein FPL14_22355 [Cohnella cholangitidis]